MILNLYLYFVHWLELQLCDYISDTPPQLSDFRPQSSFSRVRENGREFDFDLVLLKIEYSIARRVDIGK